MYQPTEKQKMLQIEINSMANDNSPYHSYAMESA